MRWKYHPDLVEQAVFLAARRDGGRECDLHEAVDGLYEVPDQEVRERAFQQAYRERFICWKLDGVVLEVVGQFPMVLRRVGQCVVAPAARRRTQAVDLLVKPAERPSLTPVRTLLMQLCPESLLKPEPTRAWLRGELYYVSDILDDVFGYAPDELAGVSSAHHLLRDRYQVLWRMYVVGRLWRAGHADATELPPLKRAFRQVFDHKGVTPSDQDFARILDQPHLTHHQLVTWAHHPDSLLRAEEPVLVDRQRRAPAAL